LAHRLLHTQWADRFRFTYHVGIVLMLAGLAIVLIPPDTVTTGSNTVEADISTVRWLAIILAAAAAAGELIWITATWLNKRDGRRRLGRIVVAGARRLVPFYDVRLSDARASLSVLELQMSLMSLGLDEEVRENLDAYLDSAADCFEQGRRNAAERALWRFKILAAFQCCFESSGLSRDAATRLMAEADSIVDRGTHRHSGT
jgi:hypothetical protein